MNVLLDRGTIGRRCVEFRMQAVDGSVFGMPCCESATELVAGEWWMICHVEPFVYDGRKPRYN